MCKEVTGEGRRVGAEKRWLVFLRELEASVVRNAKKIAPTQ